MTDQRGEEPMNGGGGHDPVRLHDLPSAKAHDPLIVSCRRRPLRRRRRVLKGLALGAGVVFLMIVLAFAGLEAGFADAPLTARARSALKAAFGPGISASIGGAGIRLSSRGTIQLQARDVRIADAQDPTAIAGVRSIDLDVAALPLLLGHISITGLEIDGASLDPKSFGSNKPFDINALRIDALGPLMDNIFRRADRLAEILRSRTAGDILLTNTRIDDGKGGSPPIVIRSMTLNRTVNGEIELNGDLDEGKGSARLEATAKPRTPNGPIDAIDISLRNLDTQPFLLQRDANGLPSGGLATEADVSIAARRADDRQGPSLTGRVTLGPGKFYADGVAAQLRASTIALGYSFARHSLDVLPSEIDIGNSKFPFSGGIIDLSRLGRDEDGAGFGLDLVMNNAVSAPMDSEEHSLPFNAKLFGRYLKKQRTLSFSQMAISTPLGSLAGSLNVEGGAHTSPEISFVAKIAQMQTSAVKQLWPFWLAKRTREWVLGNLFGGSVTNGTIRLYIPTGKIAHSTNGIDFTPDELQIDFDYQRARINIAGEIPPLREARGHFSLRGKRLDVGLTDAVAYFASGRQVDVSKGRFSIPDTDVHPLMADLDISVAGKANAVAELISKRPIDVLERTHYKPDDFSGEMTSHVTATFGLIQDQKPPKPVWHVDATLNGVDLAPKVEGRSLKDLDGSLVVDPDKAVLDTDLDIDGVGMHLALTEPFDESSTVARQQVITAKLGEADRKKLLPGLNDILGGTADVTMTRLGAGIQSVTADLTDATITIPGLGWTKGAGIAAKASMTADDTGSALQVKDFALSGDGFSAAGALTVANSKLTRAHFSDVRLSGQDKFDVDLTRTGKTYHVAVDGSAIDLRSLIKSIKGDGGSGGSSDGAAIDLDATIDTAYGFHGETLSGLTAHYVGQGSGRIDTLDVKGVTDSGEAFVGKVTSDGSGRDLSVTCGDGGAVARFADIYGRLKGGLLSIRLRKNGDGPYRGTLDLRDFSVANESALNSLVTSRTGNGRSLRDSVSRPINLDNAEFQRGYAQIELGADYLLVSNGVVRGTAVGSTFQGIAFDANGNMDLTGTFMPAYGLNRLFAEVPIVGALLGNGRDRGLIGITFRLSGKASDPKLEVNPLSVIAPGIFRQIFEY